MGQVAIGGADRRAAASARGSGEPRSGWPGHYLRALAAELSSAQLSSTRLDSTQLNSTQSSLAKLKAESAKRQGREARTIGSGFQTSARVGGGARVGMVRVALYDLFAPPKGPLSASKLLPSNRLAASRARRRQRRRKWTCSHTGGEFTALALEHFALANCEIPASLRGCQVDATRVLAPLRLSGPSFRVSRLERQAGCAVAVAIAFALALALGRESRSAGVGHAQARRHSSSGRKGWAALVQSLGGWNAPDGAAVAAAAG